MAKWLFYSVCVGVFLIVAGNIYMAADVEQRASRWQERVESAERVEDAAQDLLKAQEYSQSLLDIIGVLAAENTYLCERDIASSKIVAEFEDENRRLLGVVSESIARLQEQEAEINALHDENDSLSYKVQALERAIQVIENSREEAEETAPAPLPVQ
jgi:DNA repair exonuclease SbcCD ATPase subunit